MRLRHYWPNVTMRRDRFHSLVLEMENGVDLLLQNGKQIHLN